MGKPRFKECQYVHILEMEENIFNWLGNSLIVSQEQYEKTTRYLVKLSTMSRGRRLQLCSPAKYKYTCSYYEQLPRLIVYSL